MSDKNSSVTVLMSTYNGEKYLQEQVDSILAQTGVDVRLIIRDDGSTDGTVDIIKACSRKSPKVSYVAGENIGYANSFLSLIPMTGDSDYYAFSDQDDVWKENKLAVAIEKLRNAVPYAVYASNLEMVDEKGKFIAIKKFDNFKGTGGGAVA